MTWVRAVPYALIAALFIGIPADIIDTPIFGRPVELRTIDYAVSYTHLTLPTKA